VPNKELDQVPVAKTGRLLPSGPARARAGQRVGSSAEQDIDHVLPAEHDSKMDWREEMMIQSINGRMNCPWRGLFPVLVIVTLGLVGLALAGVAGFKRRQEHLQGVRLVKEDQLVECKRVSGIDGDGRHDETGWRWGWGTELRREEEQRGKRDGRAQNTACWRMEQ